MWVFVGTIASAVLEIMAPPWILDRQTDRHTQRERERHTDGVGVP